MDNPKMKDFTLRDHFAGIAMSILGGKPIDPDSIKEEELVMTTSDFIAHRSYLMAEAMLRKREQYTDNGPLLPNADGPEADGVPKMSFGKYKGTKVDELPANYLLWLWENNCSDKSVKLWIGQNLPHLQDLKTAGMGDQ